MLFYELIIDPVSHTYRFDSGCSLWDTLFVLLSFFLKHGEFIISFIIQLLKRRFVTYNYIHDTLSLSQALKDWVLFVLVLVIVAIDLTIILTGSVIPQSRLIATEKEDTQYSETTVSNSLV